MRLGDEHPGSGEPSTRIGAHVGPYTLLRRLGDDGATTTYLAEHTVLKTRRAVKLLSPQHARNAHAVRRFVDEARAAARLQHRNLIHAHDVGQLASGAWFMVLDHVDGVPLAERMARCGGPMPLAEVARIVAEVAAGLQAVHDLGSVHRGVTAERVAVIERDGEPLRAVVLGAGAVGAGDTALGTPAYMPPEQLRGARLSPAADVFALGVIAYQMTTGGWFPHQHGESRGGHAELSATELYHRQVSGPPIDPRDRVPGLPAAWVEALLSAVRADPVQRTPTVQAFARALADALPAAVAAPEPVAAVGVGDLGSRYQLGERLGGGGMAEVFAATMIGAEGFSRRVAIKRVLPGLSRVPAFAAMFIAEARIASRLSHPNIVSVLDFARDAEDRLYLVMEHVDGKDLASLLATGPVAPGVAIFVVIEMLRGLGHAHGVPGPAAHGVVHRDVSPQNLLLSHEGAVKLSDFGLAKALAASGRARSDVVRGKPSYMSPEQISGEALDGRTDLYAAGVMLWEMLADRALFAGTAKEITAQVMFKEVPRPSSVRAGVPRDLEAVAMTLLAHDRDARYPTAAAAIEALLGCADAPRDGRGDLARLLADRFSAARGSARASARASSGGPTGGLVRGSAGGLVRGSAGGLVRGSVAALSSSGVPSEVFAVPPRRRVFAATLGMVTVGALCAGFVLARGDVAPPPPRAPGAPPARAAASLTTAIAPPGSSHGAPPVAPPAAPLGARLAGDAADGDAGVDARHAPAAPVENPPAPPAESATRPPRRDRLARRERTGELAIIVRPWALIWLNGKPSGQTPFRAAVPAGRYRIRLANDDAGHHEVITVTVEPDRTATVERSW